MDSKSARPSERKVVAGGRPLTPPSTPPKSGKGKTVTPISNQSEDKENISVGHNRG